MKNIQKIGFLLLMAVFCLSSNIFAQAKTEKEIVIVKKSIDKNGNETEEKIILTGEEAEKYIKEHGIKISEKSTGKNDEKEMTIEVTSEGEGNQAMTIQVTTDADDERSTSVWIDDEGGEHKLTEDHQVIVLDGEGDEIPEDVRQMLIEKGIDIDKLIEEGKSEMKLEEKQQFKIVEIDDDGNKKVIEWDGEGEMPEEMKELMEKQGSKSKSVKKKIMIIEDEDVEVNVQSDKKIIKIRKDKDGEQSEDVYELEEGQEIPDEVLSVLKEHGIDPNAFPTEGKMKIQIEIEEDGEELHKHDEDGVIFIKEVAPNNAQLGVMIEEENGVRVVDFIENGAAKSAGILINDLIVKVDKVEVGDIQSLMDALSYKKAGDVVKLKIERAGKSKKIKVTLKASENGSTSNNYRTEHKVLMIKGGDINECAPEEEMAKKEALTKEEIELVEERIIKETGHEQVQVFSGSNTLQIDELDLFPNPTDGSIRVRFQIENNEETKVQVIDIAGRAIYENNLVDFSGTFDEEIDLSGKGMGTLVLVITQGNKAFTEKIVLN